MKILYMSCHDVLEYDEIRILSQLGHDVFSTGGYINPRSPHSSIRPGLELDFNKSLFDKWGHYTNLNLLNNINENLCGKILHKDFVDEFDCIIVMHIQEWIDLNVDVFKNKKVILRTIGQNLELNEHSLNKHRKNNVKVIRYSPKERELVNYAGEDTLIRFLKYKSDFKNRSPDLLKNVISFGQNVYERRLYCGAKYIEYMSNRFNFKLFGPNNQNYKFSGGHISYEEQLDELSKNSVFFYTGTYPAQYTLGFVESLMSGIPLVSIGESLLYEGIGKYPSEVCDILSKVSSLYSNNIEEICEIVQKILQNDEYARQISDKQIKVATEMFSVEQNINLWKDFLNSL